MQHALAQCRRQRRMGDDENTVHLVQIISAQSAQVDAARLAGNFYLSLTLEKNMSSASGVMVEANITI